MTRTCQWCGRKYDTDSGSSMYCEDNPKYAQNKKNRRMNRKKSSIVRIGVVIVPPSPFNQLKKTGS